jgi:hypothetical protein
MGKKNIVTAGQQALAFPTASTLHGETPVKVEAEASDKVSSDEIQKFELALLTRQAGNETAEVKADFAAVDLTDPIMRQLKDAVDGNVLSTRCALGVRFARECDADGSLRKSYTAVNGSKNKEQFRVDWAAKTFEAKRKTSTYDQTISEKEIDEGTYEPLDVVYSREGGTKAAWTRACNYANKAITMGGPWTRINHMTKGNGQTGLEFLYMKSKQMHIFERCWGKHEESDDTVDRVAVVKAAVGTVVVPSETPVKQLMPITGGDAKRGRAGESAASPADKPPKKKKDEALYKAMASAKLTKTSYKTATSQHATIERAIETSPDWAWATDNVHRANMTKARKTLDEKAREFNDFLIYDFAQLKHKHESKQFLELLNAIPQALDASIGHLAKATSKVQSMHTASLG